MNRRRPPREERPERRVRPRRSPGLPPFPPAATTASRATTDPFSSGRSSTSTVTSRAIGPTTSTLAGTVSRYPNRRPLHGLDHAAVTAATAIALPRTVSSRASPSRAPVRHDETCAGAPTEGRRRRRLDPAGDGAAPRTWSTSRLHHIPTRPRRRPTPRPNLGPVPIPHRRPSRRPCRAPQRSSTTPIAPSRTRPRSSAPRRSRRPAAQTRNHARLSRKGWSGRRLGCPWPSAGKGRPREG